MYIGFHVQAYTPSTPYAPSQTHVQKLTAKSLPAAQKQAAKWGNENGFSEVTLYKNNKSGYGGSWTVYPRQYK